MISRIALLGSSSGRNAGDAALMAGIMEAVDHECGTGMQYLVPTIRPEYIRAHYRSDARPLPTLPWNLALKMLGRPTWRAVVESDLTLLFDAILFDRALFNPLFNFMSSLYLILPRAKRRGKVMGCYDVGVGPVNTRAGRGMLKRLAELMDFITVRDEASRLILEEVGVENPHILVGADAALDVTAASEERVDAILAGLGLDPHRPFLAVNINAYVDTWAGTRGAPLGKRRFLETYAGALHDFLRRESVPVLFVCTQHMDIAITRELMGMVRVPEGQALFANREYDHYDVKGVLGRAALVCGMRLHCTIMAAGELTPVVALEYQPKLAHFFASLGMPGECLSFKDFSRERLGELMLEGWRRRDELRVKLEARVPVLKRRARAPAEIIAGLHRGEDLEVVFRRVAETLE